MHLVPNLDFSISYTTRELRGSEQNGKQYHFIPREEFDQMVRDDEFLEHAEVYGNCYGTARRFLREAEQSGHDLLARYRRSGRRARSRKSCLTPSASSSCLQTETLWSGVCAIAAKTRKTSSQRRLIKARRARSKITTSTTTS